MKPDEFEKYLKERYEAQINKTRDSHEQVKQVKSKKGKGKRRDSY